MALDDNNCLETTFESIISDYFHDTNQEKILPKI